MGSLSKKWGKVKRWNSFLHQIFFCTICSSNQFNPRIKDLGSQRKVHHEIILGTNVEVDFSAFVPSNGNLFCVKEQLMMLYITDFLCAGHRCPANWRPRKDIIYLFSFFWDKIFWRMGSFLAFVLLNGGAFVALRRGEDDTLQRTFPVWTSQIAIQAPCKVPPMHWKISFSKG